MCGGVGTIPPPLLNTSSKERKVNFRTDFLPKTEIKVLKRKNNNRTLTIDWYI